MWVFLCYLGITVISVSTESRLSQDSDVSTDEVCSFAVDIAFLVDSSKSIKADYHKELLFVQRIADRFGISETGTRAGVVIFSDFMNHTRVTIKLNDHFNTTAFNDAVANTPFVGYRTRIDYGFEKVQNELFAPGQGSRPYMNKIIFLITDGFQFPTNDSKTGELFDPVAASQLMYDSGVKIFAVGIGNDINKQQLEDIVRDPSRVYYADSMDKLISDEFVKNVSKKLCQGGLRPNISTASPPTCTEKTKPCGGVKSCGDCCGSHDVYINIFQSNSNIPYVLQGVRLTQNGNGSITTTGKPPNLLHTTDFTKMNKNEIVEILKKYLPIDLHHAVTSLLTNKKLLNDNLIKIHTKKHQVGDDSRSTKRHRKQRSVADFRETSAENSEFLQLAHLAGCSRFLKAVTKHHLIDVLLRTKHVVIFCPTDDAMENIMQSKSLTNEKQFLLNHIALNFRGSETMLKTFFKGGRIMLSLRHNGNSQLLWHANDVVILYSMKTINHRQIFVIKDLLQQPTKTIQNVLKENVDLSIFYNLWRRIPLTKLTRSINIKKLCFAKNVCIPITRFMKKHLENALRFKRFTVVIPTNSVLSKRSNKFLEAIAKNTWELRQLLLEHIYLGLLDEKSPHFYTSVSLSSKNFVMVTGQHNNKMVLLTASGNILNVKQSVTVKEGIIHIIDSTEE